MKKIIYILITLPVLIGFIVSSCGNNGCEEIRESFCLAELSSTSGAKIDQLYAYGIGRGGGEKDSAGVATDSIMFEENNPKSLEFILNPNSATTDIRLQMNITLDGDKYQYCDTIHFLYEPHPFFLNMDCGCSMYFSLQEVTCTNNFLRGVTIKRNEITNEENTNLTIEY